MAEKSEPKQEAPKRDPLVKTVSEVASMDDKAREIFRQKGGTVCEDHNFPNQ